MREEYGRSLIEVIGVLAIAGVMTATSLGVYRTIHTTQTRHMASDALEQIAKNTKLLMEMRGDYTGLSIDYLIKAGALDNANAPIGGQNWSVRAETDTTMFSINLTDLSSGECEYFVTSVPTWATKVIVNGYESDIASHCFESQTNQISFIVQ